MLLPIAFSILFISLLSLSGIIVLLLTRPHLNKLIFYLVSFAIGNLLGSVWFHLLPESYQSISNPQLIGILVLAGLFLFL